MSEHFYSIEDICTGKGCAGLLPISKATLWRWVRMGEFPSPLKLGPRRSVWAVEEVDQFIRDKKARRQVSYN